jgi:hypothetical protein
MFPPRGFECVISSDKHGEVFLARDNSGGDSFKGILLD